MRESLGGGGVFGVALTLYSRTVVSLYEYPEQNFVFKFFS